MNFKEVMLTKPQQQWRAGEDGSVPKYRITLQIWELSSNCITNEPLLSCISRAEDGVAGVESKDVGSGVVGVGCGVLTGLGVGTSLD